MTRSVEMFSWFKKKPCRNKSLRQGLNAERANDAVTAFRAFRDAAVEGDTEGAFRTGMAYLKGQGVMTNLADAIVWLKQAAEKEHKEAQYHLALSYLQKDSKDDFKKWYKTAAQSKKDILFPNGLVEESNPQEAFHWCQLAAHGGLADAQAQLGFMYAQGIGVEQDYGEARWWYGRAAEQGHPKAQFGLGVIYENGLGIEVDEKQAAGWYSRAADQGNGDAEIALSLLYESGRGVEKDPVRAISLLLYQASEENNNPRAQYLLGLHLLEGKGVPQDRESAETFLRKAALSRYPAAMIALARLHEKGSEAAHWWRAAANTGDPEAQFAMGVLFAHGQGVPKRQDIAFEWFRKAAIQGHRAAQYNLGVFLKQGLGVAKNLEEAAAWFANSAAQGMVPAMVRLAQIYYKGEGLGQDIAKAVDWLKQAAATGNSEAETLLAGLYATGVGVERNLEEAKRLLKAAAERGYGPAILQFNRMTEGEKKPPLLSEPYIITDNSKEAEPKKHPSNIIKIGSHIISTSEDQ